MSNDMFLDMNIFLGFRILKPFLTHSRPTLMETLPACCLPLAKLLTTEEQLAEVVYIHCPPFLNQVCF
jgi:hypothetical protein